MHINTLFYYGLSFMIVHEMDAVRCREWRIFPGLSQLNESLAFKIFLLAHIPVFLTLFWVLKTSEDISGVVFWLDIFFMIHVVLHLIFLKHKNNEFKDWISWTFILGAGIFGLFDILIGN